MGGAPDFFEIAVARLSTFSSYGNPFRVLVRLTASWAEISIDHLLAGARYDCCISRTRPEYFFSAFRGKRRTLSGTA
jgi:hypothetical protein